jgi:translation initiation factor 2B subunit (eIF-2B alpha/beta/delta family)
VDRLLRRELDAIARDHSSGASELTLRAVKCLQRWLRRRTRPTEHDILTLARGLFRAQPSMAPFLRLANEVALAADAQDPPAELRRMVKDFAVLLHTANRRIAKRFSRRLAMAPAQVLATYSYSSTVVAALIASRANLDSVHCSESQPGCEGRRTAQKLAGAGIEVLFLTDAALMSGVCAAGAVVLGADAILSRRFINKMGSRALVAQARRTGIPILVLADSSKLCPEPLAAAGLRLRFGKASELWRNAPRHVLPSNPYFEYVSLDSGISVITERGILTPRQVRNAIRNIRISPRLHTICD